MKLKDLWGLIKDTIKDWSEDKAPRLAASLAYYTVFSLAPLLVLVISITGFVVGNNDTIRSQILSQVQGLVGPQAAGAVDQFNQPDFPGEKRRDCYGDWSGNAAVWRNSLIWPAARCA